jgi:hypothetical protein
MPQFFRHYFITYLIKNGWSYDVIQKISGHVSIASLHSYDQAEIETVEARFRVLRPVNYFLWNLSTKMPLWTHHSPLDLRSPILLGLKIEPITILPLKSLMWLKLSNMNGEIDNVRHRG